MSVLDYITSRRRKTHDEHLSAWQRYRELLQSFVDGVEVDTDKADEVVAAAGKSESELQSDVETLANRIAWREQLDDAAAARNEHQDAEAELLALNEKIRRYTEKLQPEIDAVRERWRSTGARTGRDSMARRQLLDSVQDPTITSRMETLVAERREVSAESQAARDQLKRIPVDYHRSRFEAAERRLREVHDGDHVSYREATEARDTHKARLADAERDAAPWVEKLQSAERQLADIQKEIDRLTEASLQP